MRSTLFVAAALLVTPVADTSAQCCGTPAPTVVQSPVVAAPAVTPVVAQAPVVQTTVVRDRWYPGKYLAEWTRSLFRPRVTTYTTGYAPVAASPYTVGYAPAPYTAAYAPASQLAYRPTYPATYGPATYTAGYAPLVQTVSRPVVLSPVASVPVASACNVCSPCGACSSCGVVEQAGYAAAPACSSCQSSSTYPVQPATGYSNIAPQGGSLEPRPSLAPTDNTPAERSIQTQRPEVDDAFGDGFPDDPTDASDAAATSSDYWGAPPLFQPPANRVTRRAHPAPVRTAVYRRPVAAAEAGYGAASVEPARRLSADGWASAAE